MNHIVVPWSTPVKVAINGGSCGRSSLPISAQHKLNQQPGLVLALRSCHQQATLNTDEKYLREGEVIAEVIEYLVGKRLLL